MKRLVKLVVLVAVVVALVKLAALKCGFLAGTEDELRGRVRSKLGDHMPAEKLAEVEEKVVAYARQRGTLVESPTPTGSG